MLTDYDLEFEIAGFVKRYIEKSGEFCSLEDISLQFSISIREARRILHLLHAYRKLDFMTFCSVISKYYKANIWCGEVVPVFGDRGDVSYLVSDNSLKAAGILKGDLLIPRRANSSTLTGDVIIIKRDERLFAKVYVGETARRPTKERSRYLIKSGDIWVASVSSFCRKHEI